MGLLPYPINLRKTKITIMKKIIASLGILTALFVSCTDSEDVIEPIVTVAPTVTAPSGTISVQQGNAQDVTFTVITDGGFKSAAVTASGGTASIKSQPNVGDKSGAVVVEFTAGNTAGAGTVELTVTDNENRSDKDTAVMNVALQVVVPDYETVGTGSVYYISSNKTWTADRMWIMSGKVVVQNGATLTIEPGTIIKAENKTGADATALIIAKGGKINAVGSAASPIIFTSVLDDINYQDTDLKGSTLTHTNQSLWGGLIVLGNASVGVSGGTANIEGIPALPFSQYGGTNDADNSGKIQYVSIRHSGAELAPGNELQGLTLGGVGSGTTIDHVEIVASGDDGVEIFGGAANLSDLLVWAQGDDGIDIDQAYKGTISNAMVILGDDSDTGLEIDGTEDSTRAIDGTYTLQNVTVLGSATAASGKNRYADWKSGATGHNRNIVFKGFPAGRSIKTINASTYGGAATAPVAVKLTFENIDFITADTEATVLGANTHVTDFATWGQILASQATGTGANATPFENWTWYANK